jgi:predicted phosphodiesterase
MAKKKASIKQKMGSIKQKKGSSKQVMRFAHPFFTKPLHEEGPKVAGAGRRMTDYVATQLLPIPAPNRTPTMELEDIIGPDGVADVTKAGSMIFHTFGDSGNTASDIQEVIAGVMAQDYHPDDPAASPSFLFHLGDVIYYENTDKGYQSQFYVPYKNYPGKIIAIPGNHDGELYKYDGTSTGQKATLGAFQANFCQPKPGVPPAAGTIYREMISQPGVYWYLNTPFLDIVGLYSNIGEGPGYISGKIPGQAQKTWLTATLKTIQKTRAGGQRKGLIIATHHPSLSNAGHQSSTEMLKDIDDSCTQAAIMPDAVLSGHSHTYQRFTRYLTFGGKDMQIPYYVVGTGGRKPTHVTAATGVRTGDHSFDSAASSYGYLTVTASETQLIFNFNEVDEQGTKTPFDKTVTVELGSNSII